MIVSWMTTNQCNLKCSHCYQDAGNQKDAELTTAEGKKLIDEIARAGFKIMIFSGGEPLMRPDIYELVAYAASKGLRPVFGTNGTLITKEVAQKLKMCIRDRQQFMPIREYFLAEQEQIFQQCAFLFASLFQFFYPAVKVHLQQTKRCLLYTSCRRR